MIGATFAGLVTDTDAAQYITRELGEYREEIRAIQSSVRETLEELGTFLARIGRPELVRSLEATTDIALDALELAARFARMENTTKPGATE